MIVVNLWFVKHTNGLFHYGLDYTEAMGASVREIWVRNAELAEAVRQRLPQAAVRVLSGSALVAQALRFRRSEDLLFTPSSHPLASIRRQVVVLHDSYPFEGAVGKLKQLLFCAGLALSGGVAAYVNRADGQRYLNQLGLPEARTRFLPNRIGRLSAKREAAPLKVRQPLIVGLFGTDSPKKNYDELFAAACVVSTTVALKWRVFGHRNAYTDRLQASFLGCDIEIVASDNLSIAQFVHSIDLAVSVARNEGFARPIALALMEGIPTFLLDTPVFREFYGGSTMLFPSVPALVEAIAAIREGDSIKRPALATESFLTASFDDGVTWLTAH